MKLNTIATSVAIVLGVFSGTAGATVKLIDGTGTAPDLVINIAGSTAQDSSLEAALKGNATMAGLCDGVGNGGVGVWEAYTDTESAGSNYKAYYCKMTAASTNASISDHWVLIRKTGASHKVGSVVSADNTAIASGSGVGINPTVENIQINFMQPSSTSCGVVNGASGANACKTSSASGSASALDIAVPQMGIADLDPAKFILQNTIGELGDANPAKIANEATVQPGIITIFNAPVTLTLRNALQDAQIAANAAWMSGCTTSGGVPVNREDGACVPSLTKAQIAKAISGQAKTWDEVQSGLASHVVQMCRREPGSGSGAAMNARILNYPCAANTQLTSLFTSDPDARINSTSGAVATCLQNFDKGADASKQWAIGILSTDRNGTNGAATAPATESNYRFIKVDGVAPTLANAANGTYDFVAEGSYVYRNSGNSAPTGDALAIIQALIQKAQATATIAATNNQTKMKHSFGNSGFLAPVAAPYLPASGNLDSQPYTKYTFGAPGLVPDNCGVLTSH